MYSIGDRVVYGSSGIMEVVDVCEERVGGVCRQYYVLKEMLSNSESKTFVPTDNKKLVASMHPLLTIGEAEELLTSSKNMKSAEWPKDNRTRAEKFRSVIESQDRAGMISIIRSLSESNRQNREEGKKNIFSDELFMHKAERMLYPELSFVLGISEDEVRELILFER